MQIASIRRQVLICEMNSSSQKFLHAYLATLPLPLRQKERAVHYDYFCADEENANICAELIKQGEKRATCGLTRWYDLGKEQQIKAGDLMVVQDWNRNPVCIIEFTNIQKCAFKDVDASFAIEEGEGDKSYHWWRKIHWDFFTRELAEIGQSMSEDEMLSLEHFKLVY